MSNNLFVVEGAHDAAFFGHLLRYRGYEELRLLGDLPELWHSLVPRHFPTRPDGRLDRIVACPNVFRSQDRSKWIGISVAGGEQKIIETLSAPIERHDLKSFESIGIVIDADWKHSPAERYRRFFQRLQDWNLEEQSNGLDGFPLTLPGQAAQIMAGPPRFGVYLFPGSGRQGTLETLLLECASLSMADIHAHSRGFIDAVDSGAPPDAENLRELRKPAGRDKSHAGAIANILHPGASLAVSLSQSGWLRGALEGSSDVREANAFLGALLGE